VLLRSFWWEDDVNVGVEVVKEDEVVRVDEVKEGRDER
jgi:hypothetical protein